MEKRVVLRCARDEPGSADRELKRHWEGWDGEKDRKNGVKRKRKESEKGGEVGRVCSAK